MVTRSRRNQFTQFSVKISSTTVITKLRTVKRVKSDREVRIMRRENNGLHSIIALTLLSSRILGYFPVTGLCNKTSHALKFTIKSPYTLFYVITLSGQIFLFVMSFHWLLVNELTLYNVSNIFFFGASLETFIFLSKIGWAWPQFISKVEQRERKLPPMTRNVKRYCNIITFVFFFMTFVEHSLAVTFFLSVELTSNNNPEKIGEMYFNNKMPFIFNNISFDLWKGVICELLFNTQSAFVFPYNDLVIMVLSIYLTEHFSLHYHHLKKAIHQEMFSAEVFRDQYMTIVKIVDLINKRFGIIIVTSFGLNLYWVCYQLYDSFRTLPSVPGVSNGTLMEVEIKVYFTISDCLLLTRTLVVLFLAARVHSASKAPLQLLYEIPSSKFTVEVQKYVKQINNLKVAMSGMGFFDVTRTMILTLIGSIITYELVLLQYINSNNYF